MEMQIKTKTKCWKTPGRMAEIKNIMIVSVSQDVKQLELSCIVGGAIKWYIFKKPLKQFLKV